jgi:hypothetical protein
VALPDFGTVGPFTSMPRRNLIYHVWPVRGAMWQWNLDQLIRRVDMFNGRRILGIVHDDRSVPPEEVQEFVAGHGFEFVIAKNDVERGEVVTFPLMMEKVKSLDPNEITFYGHAKGVKWEPSVPEAVRRWAEALYEGTLDDWLAIREQLQRFAMTGCFKTHGHYPNHGNLADWHYSGTYFWLRNAYVFSRDYAVLAQFYGGVETWPGLVFPKEETGCLLMDNARDYLYSIDFWNEVVTPELSRLESTRKRVLPPPDLLQPLPYRGFTAPRMEQLPDEFEWWVELLLKERVSRVLTIGSHEGGVEWHLAREFFEQNRKLEITAIEIAPQLELLQTFRDAEERFGQTLRLVVGDSTAESTKAQLADQYDVVFIDGDHGYKACASDFRLAKSLKPKLIGLHDIVDSDWHTSAYCCVSRLWAELTQSYRTVEKTSEDWAGIGVVIL